MGGGGASCDEAVGGGNGRNDEVLGIVRSRETDGCGECPSVQVRGE